MKNYKYNYQKVVFQKLIQYESLIKTHYIKLNNYKKSS